MRAVVRRQQQGVAATSVRRVTRESGRVDILVNAAGITRASRTLDCTEAIWNAIMDVKFGGTLRALPGLGAGMLERGYGRSSTSRQWPRFVAFQEVARLWSEQSGDWGTDAFACRGVSAKGVV